MARSHAFQFVLWLSSLSTGAHPKEEGVIRRGNFFPYSFSYLIFGALTISATFGKLCDDCDERNYRRFGETTS